ncbi:hypothetical protein PAPHI01_2138 [Pancytospora philotis]|nr:hypothetical protein PAPHI01_2138 [Pancytospora philotis]
MGMQISRRLLAVGLMLIHLEAANAVDPAQDGGVAEQQLKKQTRNAIEIAEEIIQAQSDPSRKNIRKSNSLVQELETVLDEEEAVESGDFVTGAEHGMGTKSQVMEDSNDDFGPVEEPATSDSRDFFNREASIDRDTKGGDDKSIAYGNPEDAEYSSDASELSEVRNLHKLLHEEDSETLSNIEEIASSVYDGVPPTEETDMEPADNSFFKRRGVIPTDEESKMDPVDSSSFEIEGAPSTEETKAESVVNPPFERRGVSSTEDRSAEAENSDVYGFAHLYEEASSPDNDGVGSDIPNESEESDSFEIVNEHNGSSKTVGGDNVDFEIVSDYFESTEKAGEESSEFVVFSEDAGNDGYSKDSDPYMRGRAPVSTVPMDEPLTPAAESTPHGDSTMAEQAAQYENSYMPEDAASEANEYRFTSESVSSDKDAVPSDSSDALTIRHTSTEYEDASTEQVNRANPGISGSSDRPDARELRERADKLKDDADELQSKAHSVADRIEEGDSAADEDELRKEAEELEETSQRIQEDAGAFTSVLRRLGRRFFNWITGNS